MLAVARPDVAVVVEQLDTSPYLLACRNGTVDLRSGELLPADRGHLVTRGVPIDYDPDARSELWDGFLSTTSPATRSSPGTCNGSPGTARPATSAARRPEPNGTGANGKTTFTRAISGVLGEQACTAPEGLLVETRHEQHPERLAVLRGRRLVVSSELEARSVLAEGLAVKYLSGGDSVTAREMYGRRFEFDPTHKFMVVTNHLPRVRGTDEAIWRRLHVVPFAVTIAPRTGSTGSPTSS